MEAMDSAQLYTYADYLKWDDGKYYELINGRVYEMSPAPSTFHQRVSRTIFGRIYNFIGKKNKCEVFYAPFDVRLPKKGTDDKDIYTVVQPDIVVVCDPKKIDDKGCLGAPDLIVEVLSPSTKQKDIHEKFLLYQEAGVKEYWIVQPEEELLHIYKLDKEGKYQSGKIYSYTDKVKVSIFKDLEIDLSEVFIRRGSI
ncbi:MAG: Uma2 family endonuclease [Bacteroidia bacterium]|nr:Uma2 family endonuclease [Bacteroidia bacterium]